MSVKIEEVTKRVGSLIKVKPEYEERYIILHKYTFPGVLDRIRKSNIRNYTIFLSDRILFSYYEYVGKNYDRDMKEIARPGNEGLVEAHRPYAGTTPIQKEKRMVGRNGNVTPF